MGDQPRPGAPPQGVAERLSRLGTLYVPERDSDARSRLAAETPTSNASFAIAVARRLAELRALCDLANHLRRR